jgi:hypothetical protein
MSQFKQGFPAAENGPGPSKTLERVLAGAKALVDFAPLAARLKSCPVTKPEQDGAMVSSSAS